MRETRTIVGSGFGRIQRENKVGIVTPQNCRWDDPQSQGDATNTKRIYPNALGFKEFIDARRPIVGPVGEFWEVPRLYGHPLFAQYLRPGRIKV